jgi:hypothetical protein
MPSCVARKLKEPAFHNSRDGRCFPSWETIALRARFCRDTVHEAIKAEAAKILTLVNRLIRVQYREHDLFGRMELRSRLAAPVMCLCVPGSVACAIHRMLRLMSFDVEGGGTLGLLFAC